MISRYCALSFLIFCTTSMADSDTISGEDSTKLKEPIFIFELVNRGFLAELLDKGAIKAGRSGSVKVATSTIKQAATIKGSVMLQCKDSHSALAIEKSVSSFGDNTLSELDFVLIDIEQCKERLIADIARTGAKTVPL